jgi:uncharacterized protein YodC (DUF2158 family)
MEAIQPGDLVQLKSGGPVMTVSRVEERGAVCQWFEATRAMRDFFAFESLRLHESD